MRAGLRVCGQRGNAEVKQVILKFAKWLRTECEFPIRVPVYLLPGENFLTIDGECCIASFFAPWERTDEPYIRLATGDYPTLKKKHGKYNALLMNIESMAQQIIRYQIWVKTGELSDRGVLKKGEQLVEKYLISHPHL
jgi:hypothetical protein